MAGLSHRDAVAAGPCNSSDQCCYSMPALPAVPALTDELALLHVAAVPGVVALLASPCSS